MRLGQYTLGEMHEILTGETMKNGAESVVERLGKTATGRQVLELYAFGKKGNIDDARLNTLVAGVHFDNPVILGAGWDKRGRLMHGLHTLGFGGVEVGTVVPEEQVGNKKPRLTTIDKDHRVGLNSLGFNSPGVKVVKSNLISAYPYPFPIGINAGRNKTTPNHKAIEDHTKVIRELGYFASYIVLGISSPNTSDLRLLQTKEFIRELIIAAKEAMPIPVPIFIKLDAERTDKEKYDIAQSANEASADGLIVANTYSGSDLKAAYGPRWANRPGGLSGADSRYRKKTTNTVKFFYEESGDTLAIIGVGAVDSADTALEKIEAGASAVQVVTAMRPSWGRVAARINTDLLARIEKDGAGSIRDYIGVATERGHY
jgi:dihydroorotate dehydrogenase